MAEPIREDMIHLLGEEVAYYMSLICYNKGEENMRKLIGDRKYNQAVEIGTFNGVSACILADYAVRVDTFDIELAPYTNRVQQYAEKTGRNVNRHIGNAQEIFEAFSEACKGADIVFVDGDHWGDRPLRDCKAAMVCDRILVHDVSESFPAVLEAVEYLKANGYKITLLTEFAFCERK